MSDRGIGDNLAPDMAVTAGEVTKDLSDYLSENPLIENEDQAREAKIFIDRGSLCVKDLEDERTGKVKPLNEQIKHINDHYREPRELLERMTDELRKRVTGYLIKTEETKRLIAAAAQRKAEDMERIAREAEERERNAYVEASDGVLGVDLGNVTSEADARFRDFERAARAATLAEREATKVKLAGGFSRSLSLRNKEDLAVVDHFAAIKCLGLTYDIEQAIIKSARAYRKLNRKLPAGVEARIEREI